MVTLNPFSVKPPLQCPLPTRMEDHMAWKPSLQTNPCIHLTRIELDSVSQLEANKWRLGDDR